MEGAAQRQSTPGALEQAHCHVDVTPRSGAPTCDNEIVELGAAIGDCRFFVEARKIRAVPRFSFEECDRTAARVARHRAQLLGCVFLYAHQEIEPIVGRLPDQRLLHQRLQRIHGPRRVLVQGEVKDCPTDSSVNPPSNTDTWASAAFSDSSRRSHDQSNTARRVACRSTLPPVDAAA